MQIAMGTDTGMNLGRWQRYSEPVEREMIVKAGVGGCRLNEGT